MKKILLMIPTLVFATGLFAQEDNDDTVDYASHVSIYGGPSFPIGEFGERELTAVNNGSALTGASININYSKNFNRFFGLSYRLMYQTHSIDMGPLVENQSRSAPNISQVSGELTANYQSLAFLFGLYGTVLFGKENQNILELRLSAGGAAFSSAAYRLNFMEADTLDYYEQKSDWGAHFCILGGVYYRRNIGDHFGLLAGAELFTAPNTKFEANYETGSAESGKTQFIVSYSTLTANIGLYWRFE